MNCMHPYSYETKGEMWKHSVLGPLIPLIWNEYIQHGSPVFSEPLTGNYQKHLEKLLLIYDNSKLHKDFQASAYINLILADLLENVSNTTNSQVLESLQYLRKYMEHHFKSFKKIRYYSFRVPNFSCSYCLIMHVEMVMYKYMIGIYISFPDSSID